MIAHVVLHVRTAPDGSVIVTPVDFRALALGAPDLERAIAALEPRLVEALANLDAFDRASFFEPHDVELVQAPVEVAIGGKDAVPVFAAQEPADSRLESLDLDLAPAGAPRALEESDVANVLAELGDDLTARAEAGRSAGSTGATTSSAGSSRPSPGPDARASSSSAAARSARPRCCTRSPPGSSPVTSRPPCAGGGCGGSPRTS